VTKIKRKVVAIIIVGYCRVSTAEQNLSRQEVTMKEYKVEKVFSEKISGKDTNRPKLQEIKGKLQPGDTLIVTRLDRLGRSVAQASALITELLDAGVTINVLDLGILSNGSVSTLMRNVLLSFAQFERDMIVERTQ
jgi:DNA invertase Pin-like site-specific DNA recombinase